MKGVVFLLLEDVLREYKDDGLAKGFTEKTMKNKHHEYQQLKRSLLEKRGITELEGITLNLYHIPK